VLPGTGGLTRLVDKRRVRRDRADFFCTVEEGIKGARPWNGVSSTRFAPRSTLERGREAARRRVRRPHDRPAGARGVALTPLERSIDGDRTATARRVRHRSRRALAEITVSGPTEPPPADASGIHAAGDAFWPLALAREPTI